jgi:hypothetical protein
MAKTPAFWMRRWAWSFIWTPTILMIVPILGLFESPISLLQDYWSVYALFVFGPWIAGIALLIAAKRIERRARVPGEN